MEPFEWQEVSGAAEEDPWRRIGGGRGALSLFDREEGVAVARSDEHGPPISWKCVVVQTTDSPDDDFAGADEAPSVVDLQMVLRTAPSSPSTPVCVRRGDRSWRLARASAASTAAADG